MKKIVLILQKKEDPSKLFRLFVWEGQRSSVLAIADKLGYQLARLQTKDFTNSQLSEASITRWLGTPEVLYRKVPARSRARGPSEFHHLNPDEFNREDLRENR